MSQPDLPTSDGLFASDEALAGLNKAKYSTLVTDEALANLKAATEKNNWKFHVANTKAEVLDLVVKLIPDGASIYSTGSVGLSEIGFTTYAKDHPDKWDNLKAKVFAEPDQSKHGALYAAGNNAQYVITTPVAVTENAELLTADWSGTRVGPTISGQNLIVVVGGQKVVKDLAAAHDRLRNYVVPLESARCRVAYKIPASTLAHVAEINAPNPFKPGHVTYIVLKETLGY